MTELTKLETLQKAAVDAKAAFDVAYAYDAAAWGAAYDAWYKARDELAEYLKEQDNEKLEQLEKRVADTHADFYAAAAAAYAATTYAATTCAATAAWGAADSWDAEDAAFDAWVKAKLELNNHLKEQDNA